MMNEGWYIDYLIKNALEIRYSIVSRLDSDIIVIDYDDYDYSNLLTLEQTIVQLQESNIISNLELQILVLFSRKYTVKEVADKLDLSRFVVSKVYSLLLNRLAFILGNEFTLEGHINYLCTKYNLTEKQIETIIKYMRKDI